MKENTSPLKNKYPEFEIKAVSLANQIEKKDIWKKNGEYSVTSSGNFKAIFNSKNHSLIYFSKGNAFIKGFISITKNKKTYWCADE